MFKKLGIFSKQDGPPDLDEVLKDLGRKIDRQRCQGQNVIGSRAGSVRRTDQFYGRRWQRALPRKS